MLGGCGRKRGWNGENMPADMMLWVAHAWMGRPDVAMEVERCERGEQTLRRARTALSQCRFQTPVRASLVGASESLSCTTTLQHHLGGACGKQADIAQICSALLEHPNFFCIALVLSLP